MTKKFNELKYKEIMWCQLHSTFCPTPNCKVLPPGECNDIMSEPLLVYSEIFVTM